MKASNNGSRQKRRRGSKDSGDNTAVFDKEEDKQGSVQIGIVGESINSSSNEGKKRITFKNDDEKIRRRNVEIELIKAREEYRRLLIRATKGLARRSKDAELARLSMLDKLEQMITEVNKSSTSTSSSSKSKAKESASSGDNVTVSAGSVLDKASTVVAARIEDYAHLYSDFGEVREAKVRFHMNQIRSLLIPTQVNRMIAALLDFRGKQLEKESATSSSSLSTQQEENYKEDNKPIALQATPSASSLHSEASAQSMDSNHIEIGEIWKLLSEKLNLSREQELKFLSVREEFLKQNISMKAALECLDRLEIAFKKKSEDMSEKVIGSIMKVISPIQQAKYLLWLEKNKAMVYLLNPEWQDYLGNSSGKVNPMNPSASRSSANANASTSSSSSSLEKPTKKQKVSGQSSDSKKDLKTGNVTGFHTSLSGLSSPLGEEREVNDTSSLVTGLDSRKNSFRFSPALYPLSGDYSNLFDSDDLDIFGGVIMLPPPSSSSSQGSS